MGDQPLPVDDESNYLIGIPVAASRLGLSRAYGYLLARHGYLRTIPVGARRLVPVDAVEQTARMMMAGKVPSVMQMRAATPPPSLRARPPAPAIQAAAPSSSAEPR